MKVDLNWRAMKRLEVEAWKKGMWQYFMDHSTFNNAGNHVVYFHIRDKKNFWGRVQARTDGDFSRVRAERMEDVATHLKTVAKEKGFSDRMDVVTSEIKSSGSCIDKIALYCYNKLGSHLNKKFKIYK